MTSDRRFFSGDSLAQALNQAAQHFQVAPAELNYRQVEKRHGFLKVRRKVVIEIDGADPFRSAQAPAMPEASRPEIGAGLARARDSAPVEPERAQPDEGAGLAPAHDSAPAEPEPVQPDEGAGLAPTRDSAPAEPEPVQPDAGEGLGPAHDSAPAAPEPAQPDAGAGLAPARDRAPAAPEPSRPELAGRGVVLPEAPVPSRAKFAVAEGEEAEAAAKALSRVLEVAGLELESEILRGEDDLLIELWGDDQDILLRDRGRLLLAIQHLLPRAIRGYLGRSVVCKVDSDDFHMIREERLRDLAQRAADDVRRGGRPKTLEPMSPDERRIVHLTLADYPGVETESHGSGLFKRVMVRATRD